MKATKTKLKFKESGVYQIYWEQAGYEWEFIKMKYGNVTNALEELFKLVGFKSPYDK